MKKTICRTVQHICMLIAILFAQCTEQSGQHSTAATVDSSQISGKNTPLSPLSSAGAQAGDSILENIIIDTVFSLPEIKKSAREIDSATGSRRHLQVWIEDTPHLPAQPYYVVNAGEDNGTSIVTENTFYVYPHPLRIMHYDVANDTTVSLEEWRQNPGQ